MNKVPQNGRLNAASQTSQPLAGPNDAQAFTRLARLLLSLCWCRSFGIQRLVPESADDRRGCVCAPARVASPARAKPTCRTVLALASEITDAIAPFADSPFALFGHSLGGLIAFEVARTLRRRGLSTPVRLFASACRAPHLPSPFAPLHDLDEDDLLRRVNERYDRSVPKEVLESLELRELLVPALRADFAALETYQHTPQPPLDCPLTIFGGRHDRTLAGDALEAWAVHTSKTSVFVWSTAGTSSCSPNADG